jgi:hypothetical protein
MFALRLWAHHTKPFLRIITDWVWGYSSNYSEIDFHDVNRQHRWYETDHCRISYWQIHWSHLMISRSRWQLMRDFSFPIHYDMHTQVAATRYIIALHTTQCVHISLNSSLGEKSTNLAFAYPTVLYKTIISRWITLHNVRVVRLMNCQQSCHFVMIGRMYVLVNAVAS